MNVHAKGSPLITLSGRSDLVRPYLYCLYQERKNSCFFFHVKCFILTSPSTTRLFALLRGKMFWQKQGDPFPHRRERLRSPCSMLCVPLAPREKILRGIGLEIGSSAQPPSHPNVNVCDAE
jgi:hypothetical protein